MKIDFVLNGEKVSVDREANRRLVDILRNDFNLTGAKHGCFSGQCGVCSVLLNGFVVASCLIPAFRLQDSKIITIEGFAKTEEYNDILQGFESAGVQNCGYCDSGKILVAEKLLSLDELPARAEIITAFNSVHCRCTVTENLISGVFAAADIRRRRLLNA
ncbi:MAG: 2Fe-2S iron-sulfur cluster binding domain-containing protein [Spirochaetaceae bacterium]|jgi:carbon-monoxide dehydrogenase small subunit|nr:2Fe-2S iron-sulfur cluster binding domain-containing protein [Spirochaetaceae bacterium]